MARILAMLAQSTARISPDATIVASGGRRHNQRRCRGAGECAQSEMGIIPAGTFNPFRALLTCRNGGMKLSMFIANGAFGGPTESPDQNGKSLPEQTPAIGGLCRHSENPAKAYTIRWGRSRIAAYWSVVGRRWLTRSVRLLNAVHSRWKIV